jgi:hypothetical protein
MADFIDFLRRKTKCYILDANNRVITCKKVSVDKKIFKYKNTDYLIPDLKTNIGTKRFNVPQLFYRFNVPTRLVISEELIYDKEGREITGKFLQNEMEAKLLRNMLRSTLDKFLIICILGLVAGLVFVSEYAMYLMQPKPQSQAVSIIFNILRMI